MVDVLEASGANRPKVPLAVTPTSTVSGAERVAPQIEMGRALQSLGEGLGTLGAKLDEAAVPAAQAAGLAAVGRNEQGEATVELKPFPTSKSEQAFNAAATQGLLSQWQMDAQRGLQEIAAKHQSDPALFDKEAKAYVRGLGAGAKDLRPLIQAEADKLRQQHFLSLSNAWTQRQTATAKDSILVQIDTTSNEIYALSRQGGTETEEFRQASGRLGDLYGQLRANPLFGVAPDRADAEMRTTLDRARGFAMSGEAVRIYDAQGEKAAQKWLVENIRDNPSLKLDDAQRSSLVEIGRNAIAMRKGDNKAAVDANRASAKVLAKALEDGKGVPQGSVENAIETATKLGDAETAAQLITTRQVYLRSEAGRGLSDEERVRQATAVPAAPSDVHGVITKAADRYGISHSYALRVAQIESRFDPNAVNGGSNATGLFQFIPSTWRSYGAGQNARDPSANADAAMRFTIANRDQLRRSLGRDPTDGELYLAHQQGAAGAAKLLAAPNVKAVDVVGERAVLGNGGTLDMTAGQFAQKWVRKLDGATGAPPSAVGIPAAPFTQQQMAANPYLASTWLRSQMAGNKELIDSAKYVISAASNAVDKGNLPDAQTLAGAIQIANQNPDTLGRERDALLAKLRGVGEAEDANAAGGSAGALLVQDVMRRAQGAPIFVQMQAEATKAAVERGARNLKERPWEEAERRGWTKGQPMPLDVTNSDALIAGMQARASLALSIRARTGDLQTSALAPADVSQLSGTWNNGSPDQKAAILGAIGTMPDELIEPTLRSIAADGESGSLAFVAGLAREAPGSAVAVVRGEAALRLNPKLAPAKEEWARTIETNVPLSITAPERGQVRQTITAAIRNAYAGLSLRDGDESGDLKQSRLDEALKIVTGGLVEHNGGRLIPPARGMQQDQFDRLLWSLSDADFAAAASKSGTRVTAADVRRNFVLRGISDGRYALQAKNSPAEWLYQRPIAGRDIDNTSGGYMAEQRFVLDLKGRTPGNMPVPPRAGSQLWGNLR